MASNALEEVLRIVLETKGQEGLDSLRKALIETGDVSDDTIAEVDKLIDQLVELNATAGKASRMGQLAADLKATGAAMSTTAAESHKVSVRLLELYKRSEELQTGHKAAKKEVERLGAAMKQEGANTKELGDAYTAAKDDVARFGDELKENEKGIKAFSAAQTAARAELEKIEGVYAKQAAALDKLDKELSESGRDTKDLAKLQDGLTAEVASATAAIEKQAKAVQSDAQATAALKQRLQDGDEAFRKFAQAGTASAEALKRYREGAASAADSTKSAASGVGKLDHAAKASSVSLASIASRLTVVSTAAVGAVKALAAISGAALFTGAIQSAATLEEALSQVQAVSGASAAEMMKLKEAAEAGGAATKFSTLEAAQGLGELARATGDAGTAIAALPATLALAQAAGIGVAEAATLMTTTLTQFGLDADQAGRVADVMAKEVNSTTDSMTGLGNALSYAAPLAKQLGLDIEDTAAIIGVMADEGFRGERAGTALRNVFTEMSDPASKFAKALRGLGIDTTDFAEVITRLAASGDKGKAALLELDAAARPAILALVDKGGAKLAELEASLRSASGEAVRTAEVMGDNLSGSLESMKDSFDRTRRSLVEPLLEPLKDELQALAGEIEAFAASPEFETIKTELKELFVESAAAARALIAEIDFEKVAENIRAFTESSGESISDLTDNIGEIVQVVDVVGNAFLLTFNAAQTAILGLASAISEFISLAAKLNAGMTGPNRAVLEFLGVIEEGQGDLTEFAEGMGAVADEFAGRFANNAMEAEAAMAALGEAVAGSTGKAKVGAADLAAAGSKAATASREMGEAGKEGAQGLDAQAKGSAAAAAATQKAAAEMESGASRVKKAFEDLGIVSQQSLNESAESARRNFELIQDAVRSGEASAEDARRAFAAYAAAARAAVAESDENAKARVEAELRVLAAISGNTDEFNKLRKASDGLGDSDGPDKLRNKLNGLDGAASGAASSVGKAAEATGKANEKTKEGTGLMKGYALSWDGMNDAASKALISLNKYLVNGLTGTHSREYKMRVEGLTAEMQRQLDVVRKLTAAANEQNAVYDENEQKLIALRRQYQWLADEELQALIDAEERLAENRKRADEEARQRADETAAAYREQREAAAEAAKEAAESGSALTGRSNQSAQATATAAKEVLASAASAADAISSAAASVAAAEVTLRVIAEPNTEGQTIRLTKQQLDEITAAVVRNLALARSTSS